MWYAEKFIKKRKNKKTHTKKHLKKDKTITTATRMLTRFEFKDLDAMVITSEPERADTNLKLKMLAQKAGARGSPKQTKNIKKGKEKKLRKER